MNGVTVTSLDETSPAALDSARRGAKAVGANHLVPLLDAVVLGVSLVFIRQHADDFTLPRGPWVALIGDDPLPPEPALGPDAFPHRSIRILMQEAHAALIVVSEPRWDLYFAATLPSIASRRNGVIIETRREREAAWHKHCRQRVAGPVMVGTGDTRMI